MAIRPTPNAAASHAEAGSKTDWQSVLRQAQQPRTRAGRGVQNDHPIGWSHREKLLDFTNLGFDFLFAADLSGDSLAKQLGKLFAGLL